MPRLRVKRRQGPSDHSVGSSGRCDRAGGRRANPLTLGGSARPARGPTPSPPIAAARAIAIGDGRRIWAPGGTNHPTSALDGAISPDGMRRAPTLGTAAHPRSLRPVPGRGASPGRAGRCGSAPSTAAPRGSWERPANPMEERHLMSRKNPGPSHATRIRSENPRQAVAIGLMHVAWRVFDETFGRGRETAMMVTDQVGMTLEEGAAASFVRNGEMALRELLPDVLPPRYRDLALAAAAGGLWEPAPRAI